MRAPEHTNPPPRHLHLVPPPPLPPHLLWSLTARPPPSLSTPHHTACTEKSSPVEVEREIRLACRFPVENWGVVGGGR